MKNQWPVDFAALGIGSRITSAEIEKFCAHDKETSAYRYSGQLRLVAMIRLHRPDLNPYVRTQGFDVIVMNDSEAAQHQAKQTKQGLRQFLASHARNMGVDSAALDADEEAEHSHALYRNGRYATAINDVQRDLSLTPYQSTKPKLDGDSE